MTQKRFSTVFLILTIVSGGMVNFAGADPKLPLMFVPPAPAGYLLVDEEMWSQLIDEAGRHLDRARDAFLHGHSRTTALELRKAAIMMRIDAAHGQDRADLALLKSAHELESQSQRLFNPQNIESIDDLDAVSSRALIALADHQQLKAELAWKHRHIQRSGHYLRAAADNLERASFRARAVLTLSASDSVKDARILSGRLVEGMGYAVDDVAIGIEALGKHVKHFGHEIVRPLTEKR
jgi:hypothetical protein